MASEEKPNENKTPQDTSQKEVQKPAEKPPTVDPKSTGEPRRLRESKEKEGKKNG